MAPGMTATTRIVTAQRDNVIRVPDQALRYLPAGKVAAAPAPTVPAPAVPAAASAQPAAMAAHQGQVWVLRDENPVRVAVTLGLDDDTYTEIASGDLKIADQVILSEQGGGGSAKAAAPLPHL